MIMVKEYIMYKINYTVILKVLRKGVESGQLDEWCTGIK
jgi:hypothetical protein